MTSSDRQIALKILGFGSQAKMFSSPVPLGGSQGFEFGLSSEYILAEDVTKLGAKSANDVKEFNYFTLSMGKGLPHNVDTYAYFTPFPQDEGVSGFGGFVRWGFYEFLRFPAVMSLVLHGSGTNFQNLLNTRTTGSDLLLTVAMPEASLYFGGGPIRTIGSFTGGAFGITAEGTTVEEDLVDMHSVFGLSIQFSSLFVAFEVNRVAQSVYGAKIGFRF